jgi:beta-glucosidase
LTATWFKTLQDWPSFGNFPSQKDEGGGFTIKYAEGLEIGYRGRVPESRVQFPFGHGLSYTSFSYDGLNVRLDASSNPSILTISVSVTNTGSIAGKEVVQVYICPPQNGADWRPTRELKGFTKVQLSPGETREVFVQIEVDTFKSHWSEDSHAWAVDEGEYGVEVGDQRATLMI